MVESTAQKIKSYDLRTVIGTCHVATDLLMEDIRTGAVPLNSAEQMVIDVQPLLHSYKMCCNYIYKITQMDTDIIKFQKIPVSAFGKDLWMGM